MRNSIIYIGTESISEAINQIAQMRYTLLRIVAFGDDNASNVAELQNAIDKEFGDFSPVWSYVSQPPLNCTMALELWFEPNEEDYTIEYKNEGVPYITLSKGEQKHLLIGGLRGKSKKIEAQSKELFTKVQRILEREQMPIHSIVRQWNYIEKITHEDEENQHYQEFNDARSHFYAKTEWADGYPAATGIGALAYGVTVDIDAACGVEVQAIDNGLQISAHAYSKGVLIGEMSEKSTPKFERAKLVGELLYISGTAAIRGEKSLTRVSAAEQTSITLENIDELLRNANCSEAYSLRVYIKHKDDYEQIKGVVEAYTQEPVLYLFADICREELLMEIEAIAVKI